GGSVVVSWRGRVGSRGGNPPVCPLRATGARAGAERGSWGPASGGVGGPRGRSPPDLVRRSAARSFSGRGGTGCNRFYTYGRVRSSGPPRGAGGTPAPPPTKVLSVWPIASAVSSRGLCRANS